MLNSVNFHLRSWTYEEQGNLKDTDRIMQLVQNMQANLNISIGFKPMKQDTKLTIPTPVLKQKKSVSGYSKQEPSPKFIVIHGDHVGKEYHLSPRKMLIGRTLQCDIRIDDLSVSRRHAVIEGKEGRFLLKDLESTNGTSVNGEWIDVRALDHGDRIRVGRTVLEFHSETPGVE